MIRMFFLFLLMVFSSEIKSAPLLLCEKDTSIFIFDLATRRTVLILEQRKPGSIKSYSINGDKLQCYYNTLNGLSMVSYSLDKLEIATNNIQKNLPLTKIQRYEINNGTLIVSGYNMVFCEMGKLIWSIKQVGEYNLTCESSNDAPIKWTPVKPLFSVDEQYFIYEAGKHGIFTNYNNIYEVTLKNGKRKKIVKGWNGRYDSSASYILYRENASKGAWRVYSKQEVQTLPTTFDNAFWLEKAVNRK